MTERKVEEKDQKEREKEEGNKTRVERKGEEDIVYRYRIKKQERQKRRLTFCFWGIVFVSDIEIEETVDLMQKYITY